MKKIYTSLLAGLAAFAVTAQQLPGSSFEQEWVTCYPWYANKTDKSQGTTPSPWVMANTVGMGGTGATTVGEKVTGYVGNGAKMINKEILSNVIPGYFTLGTPWSTAVGMNAKNKDGGTFGGVAFTYRPDALSFYYQSTTSTEQPTVVAYSWKGTYTQADVPSNIGLMSATKVTMTDRDRNILGMTTSQGGTVTAQGTRVSMLNTRLNAEQSSWKQEVVPFEYSSSDNPEKINVIFSAGDYFSSSPVIDNSLTIDEVKLLYYSRLASLSVNGSPVSGFSSDVYSYDLSSQEMPAESDVAYTFLGTSGMQRATISTEGNVMTISVSNSNGGECADVDGKVAHTYTLTFKEKADEPAAEYGGNVYNGVVTLLANTALGLDEDMDIPDSNVHIIIDENDPSNCQFVLPDFYLSPDKDPDALLGVIEVNHVTRTVGADGTETYHGVEPDLVLESLGVHAYVEVSGTVTAGGQCSMKIDVLWMMEPEPGTAEGNVIPIYVEFNGQQKGVYGGDVYRGNVILLQNDLIGIDENMVIPECDVHIIEMTDSRASEYMFVLPNFYLSPDKDPDALLGDIVVKNVTCTEVAGGKRYVGSEPHLTLDWGGNEIVAEVNVDGVVDDSGTAAMKIDVLWLMDPDLGNVDGNVIPINVEFNGVRIITGIDGVTVDNSEYPVEYYNLQGVRVNGANLVPGIYIVRQGTDVKKILIK